ncbi:MAG: MgtC/SapB family protein [Arenicellales bacterium]
MTPLITPEHVYLATITHLIFSLIAGGLIGLERGVQGRPAGFRTHTLVCMASTLLMLLTVYQLELLPNLATGVIRIDPTRMAQGVMTGIGFLGAGVIMKERLNIRGLTTAASIWMTAAIGIMIGVGFYFAAVIAVALTLGALSLFRWLEAVIPSRHYARLEVRSRIADRISLDELRELMARNHCESVNPGFALEEGGTYFRYEMTVRTVNRENFHALAEDMTQLEKTPEFRIRSMME